jgi:hypothetical protein
VKCVCLRKRFLGYVYAYARNDGRAVGTCVKKPLSQYFGTDSSPLGGGAYIAVQEITCQCIALPPSLLKRDVRRYAPRFFGYAQNDKVGECALRRMTKW